MSSEPKNKISAPNLGETVAKLVVQGGRNGGRRTSVLECATLPCSPVNARALLLVIPALSDTDLPASPHLADVQRSKFNSVLKAMSTDSTSRPPPTSASITSTFTADVHGERRQETVHTQVRAAWSLSPHETSLHASHIHSLCSMPSPLPSLVMPEQCLTTLWSSRPPGSRCGVGSDACAGAGVARTAPDARMVPQSTLHRRRYNVYLGR